MSVDRPDGRTLRYQHRRTEILDALLEYLLDQGLDGLSFRKLAAAVGISHVTLRHHFGSKDELLLEVFDLIRAREPVPDELPEDQSSGDILRGLWAWWTAPENLRYLRLMFEAYGVALHQPTTFQGFLKSTIPHWLEDAQRLALAAGCPAEEVDAQATLLVAQVRGLLLDLLTTGEEARVADAVELLIASIQIQEQFWQAGPRA